jgi:hypothetical protein
MKSLASILPPGDPDMVNCPVRAIRLYGPKAKPRRVCGLRRLFMSLDLARVKDIQKPAIARWVVNLVSRAYKWDDTERKGGGRQASALVREQGT